MSEIYIPGRLAETDPVLFEAMCLFECLVRLGYVGEACSGEILNPYSTMFPERTKAKDTCLCVRVRHEVYENEVRIVTGDVDEKGNTSKIEERGAAHTKVVECMFAVGPLKCTPAEFPARWLDAMGALRAAPNEEKLPLLQASRSYRGIGRIAEMLKQKGFEVRG